MLTTYLGKIGGQRDINPSLPLQKEGTCFKASMIRNRFGFYLSQYIIHKYSLSSTCNTEHKLQCDSDHGLGKNMRGLGRKSNGCEAMLELQYAEETDEDTAAVDCDRGAVEVKVDIYPF